MDSSKGMDTLEADDNLLLEILVCLPSESIYKFACVSSRWNKLIRDPFLRKLYGERTRRTLGCSYPQVRLLGLVQSNTKHGCCITRPFGLKHNFMPVIGEEDARCGGDFFPVELGYFIASSKNGLLLCGIIPKIYYVGNPVTGRWETLPPPPPPKGFPVDNCLSVGLSSNEEDDNLGGKIINFRVIVATGCKNSHWGCDGPGSQLIPIETYSSRTGKWKRSILISGIPVKISHGTPPTFSGGFFHWFTTDWDNIVAYDPSSLDEEDDEDCNGRLVPRKKKNEHQIVEVIDALNCRGLSTMLWRSDNGQTMWYGTSYLDDSVEVFRKRDSNDAWYRISTVEIRKFKKDILGITQKDIENELAITGEKYMKQHREKVWMMSFMPWNPRLLMICYLDRIYVYNCIKKKLDHEVLLDGDRHFTDIEWEWTPYFHTLSKSTYNHNNDCTGSNFMSKN